MFCQNCGAELRLEAGFCAVCGASAPRPQLRRESDDRENKATRLNTQPQQPGAGSRAYNPAAGSSLLGSATPRPPTQPDPRQIRSFQAIRQASGQRGSMRSLPPVASLTVPAAPPEPAPSQASAATPEPTPEAWPAPVITPAPTPSLSAPVAAPPVPAQANGHHIPPGTPGLAMPVAPAQPISNGYHPTGPIAISQAPLAQANGYAQQPANSSVFIGYGPQAALSVSARGTRLPADIPNRLALGAIVGMLLSFFLPWVIISGSRATPLSIGWPVIVPLAAVVAVGLTILLPERTLYTRFILALPFAFGCFALGSALVVFLISSAIAANSVGTAFLGVDIGFILFALAALVLAAAGYFKFLRELPLLHAGHITLAPLPGMLGRGAANPAAPQHPSPNGVNPSSHTAAIDQSEPSA